MQFCYPVAVINETQGFGENPTYYADESRHPGWRWPGHNGLDFGGAPGDPVVAAAIGKVTRVAYEEGGYGHYIRLTHPDGQMTYYAHLSAVSVRLDQSLKAGERLGSMGASGCADGVHLHFGLRLPSGGPPGYAGYTDPIPYFVSLTSTSTGMAIGENAGRGCPKRTGSPLLFKRTVIQ